MGKAGPDFDPEAYAPVAERIRLFYQVHPLGRIETQLVSRTQSEIVFKALVFRAAADPWPAATGWAAEREGDGEINLVACLENTETSAVGRALANLGFTASRQRPSAEEMARVARVRERLGIRGAASDGRSSEDRRPRPRPARLVARSSSNVRPGRRHGDDALSLVADATLDALRLLRTAHRAGLAAERVDSLRARLRAGVSLHAVTRLESVLRHWLRDRTRRAAGWTASATSDQLSPAQPHPKDLDVKDTPLS